MMKRIMVALGCAAMMLVHAAQDDMTDFSVTTNVPADVENAFCGFVAATNAVKRWAGPLEWPKLTPEQKAALADENADALALFANACRRPKWYQADTRQEGAFILFPISGFVAMIKLKGARADQLIERGEIGAAVECFLDLLTLARTIQTDSESAICWLVADSVRSFACGIAVRIVASGKATDAELRRILAHLAELDEATRRKGLRQMVNNEFRFCFENGMRIVEGDLRRRQTGTFSALYNNFIYDSASTKRIYMDWLVKAKEAFSDDYDKTKWEKNSHEVEEATKLPQGRLRRLFASNSMGRTLLATLVPAWDDIAIRVACGDFELRAAQVIVAANLYKRKNGDFADSLEAIVPEFLPSVPKDPFGHGAALRYDKSRGIVWTVGPDRKFNGEKIPGKGSYGRNSGYVVNIDGSPQGTQKAERK